MLKTRGERFRLQTRKPEKLKAIVPPEIIGVRDDSADAFCGSVFLEKLWIDEDYKVKFAKS